MSVTGDEYDHISINGIDHYFKDKTAREMLDKTQYINRLKFTNSDGQTAELYLDEDGVIGTKLLTGSITRKYIARSLTGNVIIPDEVDRIGSYSFYNNDNIMTFYSLNATQIGGWAFAYCNNLTEVNLPSLTSIPYRTFYQNTALTTVRIPKVTLIDSQPFYGCKALKSISLPSASSIHVDAFSGCTALTSIYVPFASDSSAAANAPWGATGVEIFYNTQFDTDGNPVTT